MAVNFFESFTDPISKESFRAISNDANSYE